MNRSWPLSIIADFREKHGWSQGKLAELAGLSRPYIGALERGDRRNPRQSAIDSIADALDLGSDERKMLQRFANPEAIHISAAEDRAVNRRRADQIWVFDKPLAYHFENYFQTVVRDLNRGVRHVYWTNQTPEVSMLVGRLADADDLALPEGKLKDRLRCVLLPDTSGLQQLLQMSVYWYEQEKVAYRRFSGRQNREGSGAVEDIYFGRIGEDDLHPAIDQLMEVYSRLKLIREFDDYTDREHKGYQWQDVYDLV